MKPQTLVEIRTTENGGLAIFVTPAKPDVQGAAPEPAAKDEPLMYMPPPPERKQRAPAPDRSNGTRTHRPGTMVARGLEFFNAHGGDREATRKYLLSIGASESCSVNWPYLYERETRAATPMPKLKGRTTSKGRETRAAVWREANRSPRMATPERIAEKIGISVQRASIIMRELKLMD